MPENEQLPEPENPHLSKLNKKDRCLKPYSTDFSNAAGSDQERLSRSSVSTDDTDTETEQNEAGTGPEIREGREGGSLNGHGHRYQARFGGDISRIHDRP